MGQRSRGGALVNVQIRTLVFSCASLLSFAVSSDTSAISLEPVVNTVVSIAQVDKSKASDTKSEQTTPRSTEASKSKSPLPSAVSAPTESASVEEVPIVGEPLPELPVVDTFASYSTAMSLARPASTIAVSHPIVGGATKDSITPLQATHQGWKIFGIVWHWWLLGGCLMYYGIQFARSRQRRRELTESPVVI